MMTGFATGGWGRMYDISLETVLFLLAAGFLAAFIDSSVGGGGLISLPALLLTGMPPGIALGTNKLGSSISSLTSTISFLLSGKVDVKLVRWLFPLSALAAAFGSFLVTHVPSEFLRPLVTVMLVAVAVYTLFKKNWGERSTYRGLTRFTAIGAAVFSISLGFYDGFFGPGTGSFLIFAFLLLGFDFVAAAGNAKVLNFASNAGSLIAFMALGQVHLAYGLIIGAAMVAGALAGSRLAIRRGVSYVKPLFIVVTSLLIGKQVWDLVNGLFP
jgi:hypothetical protein